MTLTKYLKATKTTIASFAKSIGVARNTVQRYISESRVPDPGVVVDIYVTTGGKVKPNDFYSLPKIAEKK